MPIPQLRRQEHPALSVLHHGQVLTEDILPALERLRREKGVYQQYQAAEATLDHLQRFVVAHRYVAAQQ